MFSPTSISIIATIPTTTPTNSISSTEIAQQVQPPRCSKQPSQTLKNGVIGTLGACLALSLGFLAWREKRRSNITPSKSQSEMGDTRCQVGSLRDTVTEARNVPHQPAFITSFYQEFPGELPPGQLDPHELHHQNLAHELFVSSPIVGQRVV